MQKPYLVSPNEEGQSLRGIYESYQDGSESEEDLKFAYHYWIKEFLGITIPTKSYCGDHCAPFDFVFDAFMGKHQNMIAVGNRTGGKTLDFAILDITNSIALDNCETATVGAIEMQAKKCYGYVKDWVKHNHTVSHHTEDTLISKTKFITGSTVEILTATMSGVNAPHPQKVFLDEVDLMDWVVLQEAFSMSQSKPGIKGQTVITSTRKFTNGPMAKMLKKADEMGYAKYIWCVREVIEPHNKKDLLGLQLWDDFKEFENETPYPFEEADGYYFVEDAESKKKTLDPDIWEAQWRCSRPESGGLMYPGYKDQPYAKGGHLYSHAYNPELETYVGEDFGFGKNHPNVNLFVQIDWSRKQLPRIYVFDEVYSENSTSRDVVERVADKFEDDYDIDVDYHKRDGFPTFDFKEFLDGWVCDPSGLTEIEERERMGCPVLSKADDSKLYRIQTGASLIRVLLKNRQLLIHPRCKRLRHELGVYSKKRMPDGSWSQDPAKKDDHGPDNLRYVCVKLMPLEAMQSIGQDDIMDKRPEKYRPITAGLLNRKL